MPMNTPVADPTQLGICDNSMILTTSDFQRSRCKD
jgi:hypothetical protein